MHSSMPIPLFHSAAPRRPGHPLGSKAIVVQDPRALGVHHFAFVRCSLLGIGLRHFDLLHAGTRKKDPRRSGDEVKIALGEHE